MKRLKNILLFSYILVAALSIYRILSYKVEERIIDGNFKIISIEEKDTYINLIVQNKRKYLVQTDKDTYKLGEIIKIKGKSETITKNTNFYLFNYQNYLRSKKIFYKIKPTKIEKINHKETIIYKLKNKLVERIETFKNKDYFYLFIYGENKLESDLYEKISSIGIAHLLALSGMHISFIIMPFKKLKKKKYIIPTVLLIYLLIVKPSASIYRASLLEIIYELTKLNRKKILIFLFFLFLLYNPFIIYNFGFKLSFLTSFLLNIKEITYFKQIFKTSFDALLINMPLCINSFFKINFLCPIYNLFYVPFISFLLFPTIILVFIIKPLEPVLTLEIMILEKSVNLFSNISILTFDFGYLSLIPFILMYILILIFIKKRKYLVFIIIFLIIHYNSAIFKTSLNVTILDVNQGDSILLNIPRTDEAILIDTGGIYNKSLTKTVLLKSLKARSIHKVKYLILTHGDFDHMGEAINLINNFKVENVIFNCGTFNELEKELIEVLNKKKIKYYSCIKELNIDNNKLYFLQTKEYDNENDNSNVIYTELDGYKFMFMGDAGVEKEKDILNKYNISGIDVLKVGHHGSKTSSSKEFINEINPNYSIISVGKNNRYGHPNKEVLNNLSDSKIYRTDQDGSIMFKIKSYKLKIETCSP